MQSRSLPVISEEIYAKFNACVHCGFCLAACPTYVVTGDEADSPRGRIHLMKAAVDGRIVSSEMVFEHLDRCLVCRACEPACPSGVEYHTLLEAVRPQVAEHVLGKGRRLRSRTLEVLVSRVLPNARRAKAGFAAGKMAMKLGLGFVVPASVREATGAMLLAEAAERGHSRGEKHATQGERRGSVLLLRGCVGSVVSGSVNDASAKVLAANGFEVQTLDAEACCGAMAAHANDPAGARDYAIRMVELLEQRREDWFISPIAGCGAQLKNLHEVLVGTAYTGRAQVVVRKIRDITEFLCEAGIRKPPRKIERTITYHDPCHLINVQKIAEAPRRLLAMVEGLTIVALPESDLCCGAAGAYNLSQPAMAERIGRRKVENILRTCASEVITANVGCQMQMEKELRNAGRGDIKVRHLVEILAEAYG